MQYTTVDIRQLHPVWQFLLGLAGLGLLVVLVTLGLVFFAVFAGLALVAGTVLAIRGWWLGRKLGRSAAPGTLDGEYVIIEHRRGDRDG